MLENKYRYSQDIVEEALSLAYGERCVIQVLEDGTSFVASAFSGVHLGKLSHKVVPFLPQSAVDDATYFQSCWSCDGDGENPDFGVKMGFEPEVKIWREFLKTLL